jgi:hypothetical protein
MSSQLVKREYDSNEHITTEYWYDNITDELTIRKFQDIEPQIELNKAMYNEYNRPNYSDSKGVHLVARIPFVILEHWKDLGFDWFNSTDTERRAWLDKPENEFLKVRPGKLGGYRKPSLRTKVN